MIRIEEEKAKYGEILATIAEKYLHTNLMQTEAEALIQNIAQGWKKLEIEDKGQKAQQKYWEDTVKNEIKKTIIKEKEYDLEVIKTVISAVSEITHLAVNIGKIAAMLK